MRRRASDARWGRARTPDAGYADRVEDTKRVRCPYCREWVDLYIDPDTTGVLVEDCAVCCRPWTVSVGSDGFKLKHEDE